eukprot:365377-Chlamydomonas_euryale.AAC.12
MAHSSSTLLAVRNTWQCRTCAPPPPRAHPCIPITFPPMRSSIHPAHLPPILSRRPDEGVSHEAGAHIGHARARDDWVGRGLIDRLEWRQLEGRRAAEQPDGPLALVVGHTGEHGVATAHALVRGPVL